MDLKAPVEGFKTSLCASRYGAQSSFHDGVLPTDRAKNSENQREYHDIIDAIVELMGRRVDTSKMTT
jgi:hypothetical protein